MLLPNAKKMSEDIREAVIGACIALSTNETTAFVNWYKESA